MSDDMLRYTVTDGGCTEPHAAFGNIGDARKWACQESKHGHMRMHVGFTPMGKHHRTVETWHNGEREAT